MLFDMLYQTTILSIKDRSMLRSLFLRASTRRLRALFVVIALSACGGGGGGGSGGGFLPDSGGNAAPTPSFSVTVMGKNG